jgi:hypothetical protein
MSPSWYRVGHKQQYAVTVNHSDRPPAFIAIEAVVRLGDAVGVIKTSIAFSNCIPCLRQFAIAFFSSHSKRLISQSIMFFLRSVFLVAPWLYRCLGPLLATFSAPLSPHYKNKALFHPLHVLATGVK